MNFSQYVNITLSCKNLSLLDDSQWELKESCSALSFGTFLIIVLIGLCCCCCCRRIYNHRQERNKQNGIDAQYTGFEAEHLHKDTQMHFSPNQQGTTALETISVNSNESNGLKR